MKHDLITRIPFAFARSALFRPAERSAPSVNADIPAAHDYKISVNYNGPALTPCHATAWQAIVAIAYKENNGVAQTLDVRVVDILRAMGRQSVQTHAKRWLRQVITELASATVCINSPRHAFQGLLVKSVVELGNGRLRLTFSPALDVFLQNEVVLVPMASRHELTAHPLASWMHDYIATHHAVYEVPVATLHRLSDSTLTLASFRPRLRSALQAVQASGPLLTHYSIDDDVVTLHKQKTRVVLLNPLAANAKRVASKHDAAVQEARKWRVKVPL